MHTQTSLSTVFARYQTLCRHCDTLFENIFEVHQSQMRCQKGCATCCTLETVIPLEASVIASYLNTTYGPDASAPSPKEYSETCPFLIADICAIYPVRPIICRTHGLPLVYPEQQIIEVCPLNFLDIDVCSLEEQEMLNVESLTENLLRLNLAFCALTGQPETAGERIALREIFNRRVGSTALIMP